MFDVCFTFTSNVPRGACFRAPPPTARYKSNRHVRYIQTIDVPSAGGGRRQRNRTHSSRSGGQKNGHGVGRERRYDGARARQPGVLDLGRLGGHPGFGHEEGAVSDRASERAKKTRLERNRGGLFFDVWGVCMQIRRGKHDPFLLLR